MSNYSYNLNREEVVFAKLYDVNVSYKNLNAVCDAIRYLNVNDAMKVLDGVISMRMPILYKRYNKHMGSRSELGGRKGRYPEKAAEEVKRVLANAVANAGNKGLDGESMFIVHASSNKTVIVRRNPSRGSLAWGRGMYGRSSINHSDIEYAKIEIGIAEVNEKLSKNMKYFIKKNNSAAQLSASAKKGAEAKKQKPAKAAKDSPKKDSDKKAEAKKAAPEAPKGVPSEGRKDFQKEAKPAAAPKKEESAPSSEK